LITYHQPEPKQTGTMTWNKFTASGSASGSSPNSTTYPDLPDDVTWLRIIIGLAYGVSLGIREGSEKVSGQVGVLFGLNLITFLPILYINLFLNANTDTFKTNLNFVGTMNGMAAMILAWTLFFTAQHEGELEELGRAAASIVGKEFLKNTIGSVAEGVEGMGVDEISGGDVTNGAVLEDRSGDAMVGSQEAFFEEETEF